MCIFSRAKCEAKAEEARKNQDCEYWQSFQGKYVYPCYLWQIYNTLIEETQADMKVFDAIGQVEHEGHILGCFYKIFSHTKTSGLSLVLALHDCPDGADAEGSAKAAWQQMQTKIDYPDGIFLAVPRAPGSTPDAWRQPLAEILLKKLVRVLVAKRICNPNSVFVVGEGSGAEAAMEFVSRAAHRYAGAVFIRPRRIAGDFRNYRNLPIALEWEPKEATLDAFNQLVTGLAEARKTDPLGYNHAIGTTATTAQLMTWVPQVLKYVRDPYPSKVVWSRRGKEDPRAFYWVAVCEEDADTPAVITAVLVSRVAIQIFCAELKHVLVRLNQLFADVSEVITMDYNGSECYKGKVARSPEIEKATLYDFQDPFLILTAEQMVPPLSPSPPRSAA